MTGELSISERICIQRERIDRAALGVGRAAGEVTIVAASKKQSAEKIREAYEAGQRDFGENYVQELIEKAEALKDLPELRWHMIGHLQSKKCKLIAAFVHRVHTVDSLKLARVLSKRAGEVREDGQELPVLIEVNVAGEGSKTGCRPDELGQIVSELGELSFVRPVGLMAMPPRGDSPEDARPYFEQLLELREAQAEAQSLTELSMGMSFDAEVAVACGATHVRLGTALFGARPERGEL